MNLPDMMPMPMQAPAAPSPMIRPHAMATRPMLVIASPIQTVLSEIFAGGSVRGVRLLRLADINQREHHEDESLYQNDQNMEQGPDGSGEQVQGHTEDREAATEQREQKEQQLARVHVAEQAHAHRESLGGVLDQVQAEVGAGEQKPGDPCERVQTQVHLAKRRDE